jgi:hypothetical protein
MPQQNINDPRSTTGRYLRGNNVYGGGGTSPNPVGKNQYPTDLAAAAKLRRRRNAALNKQNNFMRSNSLLTDYGGLYQ